MEDRPIAGIDTHMRCMVPLPKAKEYQIPCPQLGGRNCRSCVGLLQRCAWQIDSNLREDCLNIAGAIDTVMSISACAVGRAKHRRSNIKEGALDRGKSSRAAPLRVSNARCAASNRKNQ
jgi:hypothetical protein